MDTLEPTELRGAHVTLRPLREDDAEALLEAAGPPATFGYFTAPPDPWSVEGFRGYCRRLIDDPTIAPHTVLDPRGRVIGSTTYCTVRPVHRSVEIGWTWYAPDVRGTLVNPECKLLLLTRAFETRLFDGGPAIRVELKTDARNAVSRAAILKLGAKLDGIIRHHVIMPDGHRRDSPLYSILQSEWPAVRDALRARLASPRP